MRLLAISSIFFALSSAFLLYALNNETRQLEIEVQQKERTAAAARSDIAVLKAERAHLARPERIAPFARELGLVTPEPAQIATDVAAGANARYANISR